MILKGLSPTVGPKSSTVGPKSPTTKPKKPHGYLFLLHPRVCIELPLEAVDSEEGDKIYKSYNH